MYSQRLFYFFLSVVAVKTYPDCPSDGYNSVYFPNKEDCGRFWQCSHGRPYLFNCSANLQFNTELNVCDYPQNVGCVISTEEPSKTTTEKAMISTNKVPSPYTETITTVPTTTPKITSISTTTTSRSSTRCTKSTTRKIVPTSSKTTITTPPATTKLITTPLIITTAVSTEAISTITPDNVDTTTADTTIYISPNDFSEFTTTEETITEIDTSTTDFVNLSTIPIVSDITSEIPNTTTYTISSQVPTDDTTTTTTMATPENMDYVCADLSSEYFIAPHPNDCTLFLACSYGRAYVMSCNNNLWYNSQLIRCVEPAKSDCKISRVVPVRLVTVSYSTPDDSLISICYKEVDGTYKQHSTDSDKFIICAHGFPFTMYCPEGLQFDLSEKQCVSHKKKCSLKS